MHVLMSFFMVNFLIKSAVWIIYWVSTTCFRKSWYLSNSKHTPYSKEINSADVYMSGTKIFYSK